MAQDTFAAQTPVDGQDLKFLNNQLEKYVIFLTPLLPLITSNFVDYIVNDQWDNLLTPKLNDDLMNLEDDDLNLIPLANLYESHREPNFDISLSDPFLSDFLARVRWLHLDKLKILSHEFNNSKYEEENEIILRRMMKHKKAYEVSHMSHLIGSICKDLDLDWITDIGCGNGYLGASLLVQHNFKVFAVDSSYTNISSALKLSKNLDKLMSQKMNQKSSTLTQRKPHAILTDGIQKPQSRGPKGKHHINAEMSGLKYIHFNGKFVCSTQFIEEDQNITEILQSLLNNSDSIADQFDATASMALVGLHTCGNLSPTSLKLFCKNPNAIVLCNVACCYHLLKEEFISDHSYVDKTFIATKKDCNDMSIDCKTSFDERYHKPEFNPFYTRKKSSMTNSGFPLCSYLRKIKFYLGKNARDLASKPSSQFSIDRKSMKLLFWRAIFQALVLKFNGAWPENAYVGKSGRKIPSFVEYCRSSLKKINLSIQISDEDICNILSTYESKEREFLRFYALKISLGPIIENLISLDKLIYLREQGVSKAFIVQLFDRNISPRNTAIIAIK